MHVKPKAVAGISQLFRTSDVIARYTGVINRQIKTHQKDHGCLRHLRQITKEQIYFVPHHYFHGARFVLASRNTSSFWCCTHARLYWVYVIPHAYGHVIRHSTSPVILLSNYYHSRHLFTQRGVGRVFVFSTVFLDIPTLALRRLTFPAVATRKGR